MNNFMPFAFEWAKYIGLLCNLIASIDPESPGVKDKKKLHLAILQGLLNRCSRLMLSILHLASANKFDETIRIITRCVTETAIKIRWLVEFEHEKSFERYLKDSLDVDLELKNLIEQNISKRSNQSLVIENRMLTSIKESFDYAQFSEEDLEKYKKLPSFKQICFDIRLSNQDYMTVQRMGSQAVHGAWSDLLANYMTFENGRYILQDNVTSFPHENYFTLNNLFLIDALLSYTSFALVDDEIKDSMFFVFEGIKEEVLKYQHASAFEDFVILNES